MAPPKASTSDKLSPSAYDRWWRDRIEKEEGKPSKEEQANKMNTLKLNTLGGVQEIMIAGDHLMGAGAMVRPRQSDKEAQAAAAAAALTTLEDQGLISTGSQAGGRSRAASVAPAKSHAPKAAGSVAASGASYPKTPNFSQAGGSVTSSVIMGRLARLEQELVRERLKREAAEKEMTDLMTQAAHLPTTKTRA